MSRERVLALIVPIIRSLTPFWFGVYRAEGSYKILLSAKYFLKY